MTNQERSAVETTNITSDIQQPESTVIAMNGTKKKQASNNDLLYTIEESPAWPYSLILGLQHYLIMFGCTVAVPYLLAPALCIGEEDPARAHIISTIIFVSGIITLLQTLLGVRLPIVQGATYSFLVPTIAILNLPEWKCPANMKETVNGTMLDGQLLTQADKDAIWHPRMQVVSGAIIVAPIILIVLSITGLIGKMLRYITPLTIAPVISLIGLALFQNATEMASGHWGIAVLTIILLILFSQYIENFGIPCCCYSRKKGMKVSKIFIFKLFPLLLAIIISWILCAFLTIYNVLPPGNAARTDKRMTLINNSPWIRVPYPGQWGAPIVTLSGVIGILAGVIAATVESIGNYYACARIACAPAPPVHAVNRGIFIEGVGCILAGIFGAGNGTTSYSPNIGIIAVSKVGSRRVVVVAGIFMMFFGLLSKFGALFVTIPDPIVGGVFFVVFGMIASVGISNLQFVDMNSSRNLMISGFSLFCGLAFPLWFTNHPDFIRTGSEMLDGILQVLLCTNMFVGGFLGFILDNTIPGTDKERGLTEWLNQISGDEETNNTYDLPYITKFLRSSKKLRFLRYFPLSPTFEPETISCPNCRSCKRKKGEDTKL